MTATMPAMVSLEDVGDLEGKYNIVTPKLV